MKYSKLFVSFLIVLIINLTFSSNFVLKTSQNDQKLLNYVCSIIKDITKSKVDTQDVLIGNLSGKMWSATVNGVSQCIGYDSAVIVSDFKAVLTDKSLRKATVVVLMFKRIELPAIKLLIQKHHFGSVWHHMTKIICLVPYTVHINQRLNILSLFLHFGFLDVAVIHENAIGSIQVEVFTSILGRAAIYTDLANRSLIFSDKLRSMNRFQYNVIVYDQPPSVKIINKIIHSPLLFFLLAVTAIQNSRVYLTVIDDYHEMKHYWMERKMHLTINTGVTIDNPEPELQTYEDNGYCVLVPLPPKFTFFQSIFVNPFDGLTWLFFVLTMACCIAVFWIFQNHGAVDSPWLLAYGMIVMFIGQGVNFSQQNRLVLTILLQLIIVMIWILSNAYEGVVTSFMIQPNHEHRLMTFDDFMASNYEVVTDEVFMLKLSGSEAYRILKSRIKALGHNYENEFGTEVLRQQLAFIMKCDNAEILLDQRLSQTGKKMSDYYYLIPQKVLTHFEQLEASFLNPFLERFQYFMDLSFQAGLMHIWKVFNSIGLSTTRSYDLTSVTYLKLGDFTQVFSILLVGFVIANVVFFVEFFLRGSIKKLKLAIMARKLGNRVNQITFKKMKQPKHPKYQKGALYYIIHRRKRVKRLQPKKLKVRRIYIQPRFSMD